MSTPFAPAPRAVELDGAFTFIDPERIGDKSFTVNSFKVATPINPSVCAPSRVTGLSRTPAKKPIIAGIAVSSGLVGAVGRGCVGLGIERGCGCLPPPPPPPPPPLPEKEAEATGAGEVIASVAEDAVFRSLFSVL